MTSNRPHQVDSLSGILRLPTDHRSDRRRGKKRDQAIGRILARRLILDASVRTDDGPGGGNAEQKSRRVIMLDIQSNKMAFAGLAFARDRMLHSQSEAVRPGLGIVLRAVVVLIDARQIDRRAIVCQGNGIGKAHGSLILLRERGRLTTISQSSKSFGSDECPKVCHLSARKKRVERIAGRGIGVTYPVLIDAEVLTSIQR